MEHSPPPFFRRGPTPQVRLLVCALTSIALLIADARYSYLENVRKVASVIVYPLQRLAGAPRTVLDSLGEFFVTQNALRSENAKLAAQNLTDAVVLRKYSALSAENAHLRELLGARERFPESTQFAEVLYAGRDVFTRKIVIDKGQQHGVKTGQPVIDQIGIIGQVTRIYPWLSEVTLIIDKEQTVPIQNLRNGLRAVIGGTGNDGQLELKFIPLNADFQNGDQLVTSGIDGVYPPGLPVAEVTNVERNAAYLFARITCKPLAGVTSHSQVLVLNWENKQPARPAEESKAAPRAKKPRKGA
ncbi:MAG: Cell shape-determining protein MreC [Betaproteobacteria bacterium]|nr:Cell shape-determining protein MreC [Betaproteobacteria bacterium]